MKYKASKDNVVKIITTCVILLFVFLAQQCIRDLISATDSTAIVIQIGVLILLISIILLCYVLSPRFYLLNEKDLIINKVLKSRLIKYGEILEVKPITKVDLKGTYRTFGVGGLFGYYGKFRNHQLGAMTWYATQGKNYTLLILKSGEKIILTPDDVEFANALSKKMAM